MSALKNKFIIFFEFISFLLVIISYILYIIQSFINQHFLKSNSKAALTERLLYEKFSEEIYNNIRSYPIKEIKTKSDSKTQSLILEVKLDTYFDCQGVNNGLLNEDKCQNKIVNNLTCCKSECCYKDKTGETRCNNYNFDIKKNTLSKNILIYNNEEIYDDPKRRYCQYMNRLSGKTSKVLNYNLQMELFNYSYENILLNVDDINSFIKIDKKENQNEGFKDCGEIDSLKRHLFVKDYNCPVNYAYLDPNNNLLFFDTISPSSLGIFVKNYLSEMPPFIHEWNDIFQSGNISIKDINNLIKKNFPNSDYDNYYKRQDAYFYVNQIPDFSASYANKVNQKQKIYWYSTNYIGFDTVKDLNKFKNIFNENNMSDNPLYKIREKLIPSVATSVICILLLLLYIIFFIRFAKEVNNNIIMKLTCFKIKEIITLVSLIVYFIIYLVCAHGNFKKININLDANYKEILNLYNERRKQKYFLAGIILHFIACAFEFYYFFAHEETKVKKYMNNIKSIDKVDSTESDNNLSNTKENNDKNIEILQNSEMRMKESLKVSVKTGEKINHRVINFEP